MRITEFFGNTIKKLTESFLRNFVRRNEIVPGSAMVQVGDYDGGEFVCRKTYRDTGRGYLVNETGEIKIPVDYIHGLIKFEKFANKSDAIIITTREKLKE
jgi:hypothetical protein